MFDTTMKHMISFNKISSYVQSHLVRMIYVQHTTAWYPWRLEEGFPGIGVMGDCKPLCG